MKVLTRVLLWGFLFCFPVGANAQGTPSPEIGAGLVCNSAQQVERYLTLYTASKQSPEAAIHAVNTEAQDANACVLAAIAFVRNEEQTTVPAPGGQMRIVKVTIVATRTPSGWLRIDNLVQYTAIYEKLEEA